MHNCKKQLMQTTVNQHVGK